MDPQNLLGGALVTAVFVVGGYLWNRFWNPIRWHLRYNGYSDWRLKRVTGPRAREMTFRGRFTAPPKWLETGGDLPSTNAPYSPQSTLARDQWRDIEWRAQDRNFVLEWAEWSGRREYEFHIFTNTLDIDVRRRDVRTPRQIRLQNWRRRRAAARAARASVSE